MRTQQVFLERLLSKLTFLGSTPQWFKPAKAGGCCPWGGGRGGAGNPSQRDMASKRETRPSALGPAAGGPQLTCKQG